MFKNSKIFFWTVEILLTLAIIFLLSKVSFIFTPINAFLSTLLMPFLIAGFLYYLFNPLVNFLQRLNISRNVAITVVMVILFGLIIWAVLSLVPKLINQINQLISSIPDIEKGYDKFAKEFFDLDWVKRLNIKEYIKEIKFQPEKMFGHFLNSVTSSFSSFLSTVINAAISALLIPMIFFYMLKDGHKFIPSITRFFPKRGRVEITGLLQKTNKTLSSYISGQFIDCFIVGLMTVIGYMIIDLPFGLLLGVFAGITNIIPYLGPYIGVIPALLVALTLDPSKIIWVAMCVAIIHTIDGNIVYPNVIGKVLDIHPLTIIVLLLVAGNMFGLLGMILVVPIYAVIVTISKDLYQIYRVRHGYKISSK